MYISYDVQKNGLVQIFKHHCADGVKCKKQCTEKGQQNGTMISIFRIAPLNCGGQNT